MTTTRRKLSERFKWLLSPSLLTLFLTVTIQGQQPAGASSPAQPPVLSPIAGRVVNESGQPLPGVSVFVAAVGGTNGQRTATDNEGYFKALGLDSGTYRIFASSPGYVLDGPPPDPNNSATYYRPGDSANLTLIKGGVIAGTLTDGAGVPLVNVSVRALRVRDAEGKPVQAASQTRERFTDDRGYYRIYGLQPGSYIVSAGGRSQFGGPVGLNAYANQAPTYAPAATRDTAAEIVVRSGEEAIADIHHRGEAGHSISGRITGVQTPLPSNSGVRLIDLVSRTMIASAGATGDDRTFQLNGVSDGDYEIGAISGGGPNTDMIASSARRVSVRGSDVTGIELTMAPLASIAGRVTIETDPQLNCGTHRDNALRETLIIVRRAPVQEKPEAKNSKDKSIPTIEPLISGQAFAEAVPNDNGEIKWRNLFSGAYRFETRLPGRGWYVKAITVGDQKGLAARASGANIPRDGVGLKSGDKVAGLFITITEGGASLRGRLSTAADQRLPSGLYVFLVPAEKENAENVLRFFEVRAESDGRFSIGNVAPGRYWIIARPADESDPTKTKSVRQDSALRLKVFREAEALKKELPFKPCERTVDYDLLYAATSALPKQ